MNGLICKFLCIIVCIIVVLNLIAIDDHYISYYSNCIHIA